jgi:predicted DNA-binding protein (UPF0251 family)
MNIPRKRKKCLVGYFPPANYYKPAGVPLRELDEVKISVEEFEALRLKDLEGMDQEQCAERMGIARTTFQRILYAARSKIAGALVEGKAIRIEGGEYIMQSRPFKCVRCGREFEVPRAAAWVEGEGYCPRCSEEYDHSWGGPGHGGRHHFRGRCRRNGGGGALESNGIEEDKE